ncbi:MAG: hypothetical protein M0Q91_05000 [Methanoregula sp.]|jgi:hypothetical protein|nr:hypothetical protein [Methanoregula sp.]
MKTTLYHGSRKFEVDTKNDILLFAAPRPSSRAGDAQIWRKDLYMYKSGKDQLTYYFHLAANAGRSNEKIVPVSPTMAERFLLSHGLTCSPFKDDSPVARLYAWGYGIAEEF